MIKTSPLDALLGGPSVVSEVAPGAYRHIHKLDGPAVRAFADVAAECGAGDVRVRVIRCRCRPGEWPCECNEEVK